MRSTVGDGIRLKDLLSFTSIDVETLWPDVPILMIVGDQGKVPGSDILMLSDTNASTSVIELGARMIEKSMLPSALIAPVAAKCDENLIRPVVIGRSESADIYINHPSISKSHATIYPPTGHRAMWRIKDNGSSNGSRINNIEVEPSRIYHMRILDDLTLGSLSCKFMDAPALNDLIGWIRIADDTR